jgi:CspA family cold shock protein
MLADKVPAAVSLPRPVRARLKWFNVEKGFGFVTPLDGEPEAFLHASVLARGGVGLLSEGAVLNCAVAATPKGPQVVRVDEVLAAEPAPTPDLTLAGTVKWYQPEKGFGFVIAEDGGRDIFVHRTALKRSGLDGLAGGQRVMVAVVTGAKGREARTVVVLPAAL